MNRTSIRFQAAQHLAADEDRICHWDAHHRFASINLRAPAGDLPLPIVGYIWFHAMRLVVLFVAAGCLLALSLITLFMLLIA